VAAGPNWQILLEAMQTLAVTEYRICIDPNCTALNGHQLGAASSTKPSTSSLEFP